MYRAQGGLRVLDTLLGEAPVAAALSNTNARASLLGPVPVEGADYMDRDAYSS